MEAELKLQNIFQTLGDVNRLRIIQIIGDKVCSVSEIVAATKLSQPLVSHHLRVLRESGLLKTKREGPFIYYELSDIHILDALCIFREIFVPPGIADKNMFPCREQFKKFFNKK
jgi:DNA-binding transcriptional ArsR family regulator